MLKTYTPKPDPVFTMNLPEYTPYCCEYGPAHFDFDHLDTCFIVDKQYMHTDEYFLPHLNYDDDTPEGASNTPDLWDNDIMVETHRLY